MSNQDFKQLQVRLHDLTVLLLLLICPIIPAFAADKISLPEEDKQIFITSDHLVSDKNAGYAEFTGSVRANQGKDVITSDSLRIFFAKNIKSDSKITNEETIKKIIAKGNVEINFDNRVAVTEQAVYNTLNRVFILTGENSKVTTGNNFVTGKKITIHRDSGRISFERGNSEQVKAVIHAGDKGLK